MANKSKINYEKVLSEVQDKYKAHITIPDDRPLLEEIPRLQTGIFNLDYALGGGVPIGRISKVYGPKSGGKTMIWLKTVARAQNTCRKCRSFRFKCACKKKEGFRCIWFDVEGVWENKWARRMGVDTANMLLSTPETAEQVIDVGEAIIKSGEADLIVIDSLAAMTPSVELEVSSEKWQQGLGARLLNKMFRTWGSAMTERRNEGQLPTILLINQIRLKIGVMYGNPETVPGGVGQGFSSSAEIRVWAGKYDYPDGKVPASVLIKFEVVKNKTYINHIGGTYRFWVRDDKTQDKITGDTNSFEEMYKMAKLNNLIKEEKNIVEFEGITAPNHKQLRLAIEGDTNSYHLFYDFLLKHLLLGGTYEFSEKA